MYAVCCKILTMRWHDFITVVQMRKTGIIVAVVLIVVTGAYLFIRYKLLGTKDNPPDMSKSRSVLDLRPALIAKLQQVVQDGSRGLYRLSLDSIEPDVLNGSIDLVNAKIIADSSVLLNLDATRQAPDEIYAIHFRKLSVHGIGIPELVNSKRIHLTKISITDPEVIVTRKERTYNAQQRVGDTLSLYQRIMQHVSHISVDSIAIINGSFRNKNLLKPQSDAAFLNIQVAMTGLLIDSTTQYSAKRFLFADNAVVSCGKTEQKTADGLYTVGVDSVYLNAKKHELILRQFYLKPRGDKAYFRKKLVYRGDRFDISVPRLHLEGVQWDELFKKNTIAASGLRIEGGYLKDFVDGSMPPKPRIRMRNFPYQVIRGLDIGLNIPRASIKNFDVAYSEYFPPSKKSGTLYFDNIEGTITNLITLPGHIKPGMWFVIAARTRFMHQIPGAIQMRFDMNRYQTGVYTASIRMGKFEGSLLNPVTENLALFTVKKGAIDSVVVDINGNNSKSTASVKLLYHDLHITTLKKQDTAEDEPRKKRLINFFMNTFIIRNDNPGNKDAPRVPVVSVNRPGSPGFFNFAWRALRYGIMSSVGVPDKLIPK